jgi:DNA-binding response OmpR family regulator
VEIAARITPLPFPRTHEKGVLQMDPRMVLVADDERDMVETLKFSLETHGYRCLEAYDGQDALDKARTERPDLIILDVMMPKINGFQVSRLLKFDKKYKHIPIIMLTARTQEKDRLIGDETGADKYLTKPFEMDELISSVDGFLKT